MSKKGDAPKNLLVIEVDPTECPFREFRDSELAPEFWGLGPAAFRAAHLVSKTSAKPSADYVWIDDQTQPLSRSVRQYLHSWVRAEDLALRRWDAEVVIFEENGGGKLSVMDIQLSHAQVLLRSSFCRKALSACFILERTEGLMVEHQWENFVFAMPPEGWRARCHIYSPGIKPGGGQQHRPGLSKNGCYLVRLYYLGAWRCVWVSDQVPVDATDAPLLPFSPLLSHVQAVKPGSKAPPTVVTAPVVHLWPLLLCKALLKLAAPDMNSDEDTKCADDEMLSEFDIMHALTGAMNLAYDVNDADCLWDLITTEVPVFAWEDDDDTLTSTVRTRSTKKPTAKETSVVRRSSMTSVLLEDTMSWPPYTLPGITPGHEMSLIITMARDLPLKKPLQEPEVSPWKQYRWVDWAKNHGLYEAYDCPRTRFLKVNGLLKMSHAPHLLEVQSTESITTQFREEHGHAVPKKAPKDLNRSTIPSSGVTQQIKEELREWIQYSAIHEVAKNLNVLYYPSMFQFTSASSKPPLRYTKLPPNKALDIAAPKSGPLYLQIDGPDEIILRLSLSMLHPRILFNSGVVVNDFIEPAYLVVEVFEWFVDREVPRAKAFLKTRGYETVEISLRSGRHVCRIWVHSRMNWHLALLSESSLLLGSRDVILSAAVRECPWAERFLSIIGTSFTNWLRTNRSNINFSGFDKEFYKSYLPDLEWDHKLVGYHKTLLHWMFKQALQSTLMKKLQQSEFRSVCVVLRRYFCDPDFGFPSKPLPSKSLRDVVALDPCDCVMPEIEEAEIFEEFEELVAEEKVIVDQETMTRLLTAPINTTSNVCELATEELPCGLLREEREKVLRQHEAATIIQAHWRGTWARKCLTDHVSVTPEIMKFIMENAFGNLEALSALMNEFFAMYPETKHAYSLASALIGAYSLHQHHGSSNVTAKDKWIPYFQGIFYCHSPVKVHLDIQSTLQNSVLAVYDNDAKEQMPQAYNTHLTFDFKPNELGYTIIGYGNLKQQATTNFEVHWQLTILSSIANTFHLCDNDIDGCKEVLLQAASKLHIDEIFIPNRRNILGGVQISVTKNETVCFRAAATSPELDMQAILRTTWPDGSSKELGRCLGRGELHWPYIRLKPLMQSRSSQVRSMSQADLKATQESAAFSSARSFKVAKAKPTSAKTRSATKLKDHKPAAPEPKLYSIEVTAINGWPLTMAQWNRVMEVCNSQEYNKVEAPKKIAKEKTGSAKEKDKPILVSHHHHQPQPGDAYVELECSLETGCNAKRDDDRDVVFAATRRSWDLNDPGRNARGALIRKDFRAEFLETLPPPPSESEHTFAEEMGAEATSGEESKQLLSPFQQRPTPVTESGLLEMSIETEEESKYIAMPEQLKDKFIPLYFVPFCTKELKEDEIVIMTPEMEEASKKDRQDRIEAALERMRELQTYNEINVLGKQKIRCQLLERLLVDSQWTPELVQVLEERDDAIAQEALCRTLSANKKKQEAKKK